jgi:hypothetical protein
MAAAVKIRAAVTAYAGELKDDLQILVACPTATPETSVIAFSGPGIPEPIIMPSSRALTVALRFAHGSVVVAAEKDNPARNAAGRLACLPGMEGESDTMMAVAQCERASRRALAHARD